MSRAGRPRGAFVLAALLITLLVLAGSGLGGAKAHAQSAAVSAHPAASRLGQGPTAGDTFEPVLGVPVEAVTPRSAVVLGASPKEGAEETWGYGAVGDVPAIVGGKSYADQYVLLEHREGSTWQVVPLPEGANGKPLTSNTGTLPAALGPLGGRTTAAGGVVLLTDGGIVARNPGGQPQIVPEPEAGAEAGLLGENPETGEKETLPPQPAGEKATTSFAAVEEGNGHTGLLIVPYHESAKSSLAPGVLHYDGSKWSREKIELLGALTEAAAEFTPEALACGGTSAGEADASSPANCWLLAAYKSEASVSAPNRLALFRRTLVHPSGEPSRYEWQKALAGGLVGEESSQTTATALARGAQMLTVTSQGVWIDFAARPSGSGSAISVSELVSTSGENATPAKKWCYPPIESSSPESRCPSLGAPLPSQYRSFAWSGSEAGPGTRIITGLSGGAMLELQHEAFTYEVGASGQVNGGGGAAFTTPQNGWVGNGAGNSTEDRQGQAQIVHVTSQPQSDQLQEAAVPFRYPLLAVAQAPGTTPGDPEAQALAVGVHGQVGRYVPGEGWQPEALYDSAGKVVPATLRGVAWPEAGRAYAVGDGGAMWLWRAETGLWEPDAAKPLNLIANLTGIAFSPTNPGLGFAVGKGGTMLRFGKSWVQEPLPKELENVNFTSIAFAGGEALATYRTIGEESHGGRVEAGGLAVKNGEESWHVDSSAATLLATLPHVKDSVLSRVAGLPDGGAVAAGPSVVIERDSEGGSWRFAPEPLPQAQNVSALGAYRDGSGTVRAIVSIDLDEVLSPNGTQNLEEGPWKGDEPPPPAPGEPPFIPSPDPLPDTGYVLEETGTGWSDMEHMALQAGNRDMPVRPDPALALLVAPNGSSGLAVGGQTYDTSGANTGGSISGAEAPFETAAVMRFGAGASAVGGDTKATVTTTPGDATFAVGGEAACVQACAGQVGNSLGPDVSLAHALERANQIHESSPGLREFLYTGGRLLQKLPQGKEEPLKLEDTEATERELERYSSVLAHSSIPVRIAASPNDVVAGRSVFTSVLGQYLPGASGETAYYSFLSGGAGGSVQVIVLDCSSGEVGQQQREWLEKELNEAAGHHTPAIVMGNGSLGFHLPDEANSSGEVKVPTDAEQVSKILVEDHASAYVFDYPGANVQTQVRYGENNIPAFGTGTLGYVRPPASFQTDSLASSGFLILDVHTSAGAASSNQVPVTAHVEPNIGKLALDATDGVFLRRSQVALFEALARRPAQGLEVEQNTLGGIRIEGADPYEQIPFNCLGSNCPYVVPTEYTFTSSNPEVGGFVEHNPTSGLTHEVLLNSNNEPVHDEPRNPKGELNAGDRFNENSSGEPINERGQVVPRNQSGLFCAYNPGTTTVSITTGGLTYSETVTIQAGSVAYPCGTVPVKGGPLVEKPAGFTISTPSISPATTPPPAANPPLPIVLPAAPPLPVPAPPPPPAPRPPAPAVPNFFLPPPLAATLGVILPTPLTPPEPTPPSGVAGVFEPAQAPKEEKEEEEATEMSESKAVAYDANHSNGPSPWPILVLVLVAAGGGAGLRRGRRSGREEPSFARAAAHQRRYSRGQQRTGARRDRW